MFLGHLADNNFDQILTRLRQIVECYRILCHPLKAALEFRSDVEARRFKDFRHRPIVAQEVDNECFPQLIAYSFVSKQVTHVEKVAWMLAIEGGHDLPA